MNSSQFNQLDWQSLYQDDVNYCLKILNNFAPKQQWEYQLMIDDQLNWPVWTFNSQDKMLAFWSDDMINFHFNHQGLAQFFNNYIKAFKFDGRLLSQSSDTQINQKILEVLQKVDFNYTNRFDKTFQKYKQIANLVTNYEQLIEQINNQVSSKPVASKEFRI